MPAPSEAGPRPRASATALFLAAAAQTAERATDPFVHWQLHDLLRAPLLTRLRALALPVPAVADTAGRRETHNATRRFLDPALQDAEPACADLAASLQSPFMIGIWQALCGVSLAGCYLRIEYCQDTGGFWLEPHTDIGAKRFTMLIYLADPPPGECWGTDLLRPDGTLAVRATGAANTAILFIPGPDTWHAFAPRPITGIRRTLIVNYVVPDWRARHELSFPDQAVG